MVRDGRTARKPTKKAASALWAGLLHPWNRREAFLHNRNFERKAEADKAPQPLLASGIAVGAYGVKDRWNQPYCCNGRRQPRNRCHAGNWHYPEGPARWNWQVRQKEPSKMLVKGTSSGTKRLAELTAQAAKKRFLALTEVTDWHLDNLDKCLRILRTAVAEGSQESILLVERTVDEYLASFPDARTKAGGLQRLERALQRDWTGASGPRLDVVNTIFAYLDRRGHSP